MNGKMCGTSEQRKNKMKKKRKRRKFTSILFESRMSPFLGRNGLLYYIYTLYFAFVRSVSVDGYSYHIVYVCVCVYSRRNMRFTSIQICTNGRFFVAGNSYTFKHITPRTKASYTHTMPWHRKFMKSMKKSMWQKQQQKPYSRSSSNNSSDGGDDGGSIDGSTIITPSKRTSL